MLVTRMALAILVLLMGTTAGVQAADDIPGNVWCDRSYWFSVDEPAGWAKDTRFGPLERELVITFLPPAEERNRDQLRIIVSSSLPDGESEEKIRFDPRTEVDNWIAASLLMSPVEEILPFTIDHRAMSTAGARLRAGGGTMVMVFLDPRTGRGNALSATLTKKEHPIAPGELALFEETINSIDFDPRRGCAPDATGEWKPVPLPAPSPAAAAPLTSPKERSFDRSIAFKGCGLQELFVPIVCSEIELEGRPTLFASFDEGPRSTSAQEILETYVKNVARPFCFEAGQHPNGAPRLVFHAKNAPTAHEYDCKKMALGRAIAPPAKRQ